MSIFTDPLAAIEEAEYEAEMTGWPQSIIRHGDAMTIMAYHDAILERVYVLETVNPPAWEAVA
ncbi:hypothetical protein RSO41_06020 [Halomonas sp. I1]|uniref:hypothetical protein n=1 Tax=Halomonas sp. I1 TaxID=393536 RepID=UPI0028E045DC|nr:hypothetical protein [Halomonas sp. I1]MDT8894206.1 hypothetical protein [Halomonas sp. I1]